MATFGTALARDAQERIASNRQAQKTRDILAMHGFRMLNVLRLAGETIGTTDREALNNLAHDIRKVLDAVDRDFNR